VPRQLSYISRIPAMIRFRCEATREAPPLQSPAAWRVLFEARVRRAVYEACPPGDMTYEDCPVHTADYRAWYFWRLAAGGAAGISHHRVRGGGSSHFYIVPIGLIIAIGGGILRKIRRAM
jgi:hypothetical protein